MAQRRMFSALRVRRRLEDIAQTIAAARASDDMYMSLDTVEHALLAVMDELAELALVMAEQQVRPTAEAPRPWSWVNRLAVFRSPESV